MAREIKRPALDFERDIAIGLDLPLTSANGSGFSLNYTTLDQAVANAKNLLLTNWGERPMRPKWGCNLRGILFENSGEFLIAKIEDTIRTNFEIQLPYINIISLEVVESTEQANRINIKLSISLQGNEFDTRQIFVTLDQET